MPDAPAPGVVYADGDYAGFFRRLVILVIDGAVLALLWGLLSVVEMTPVVFYAGVALSWAYLTLLEATVGTLGFRLTGSRIITLEGKRPSALRMTYRLLLWIFGPINAVVDFVWLSGDAYRQTLRDKFAGTLVVRRAASPAGAGDIRLNRYQFLGFSLVFYEVTKPA